ncbi:hypothetical protein [Zunongwangia profunda]|uniref:hypothetical protein n=1 Tax=Zunongwangia profunda TaxID=398743 RepID=UPI00248E2ACF|nr:hypothetical protein [Zunongwangia profunda]|tara:strand:+ start:7555 stop:7734 length:180 start_codon:yes stop_codon:yes gene_type:complete
MKPLSPLNTIKVGLAIFWMGLLAIVALKQDSVIPLFFTFLIPLVLREITAEEMPEDYDQ